MARVKKELRPIDKCVADVLAKRLQIAQDIADEGENAPSQKSVALEARMSQNRVGIILRGESPAATVGEVYSLARALGVEGLQVLREAEELLAARESVSSRENVPPVSPVELDLSRWNVAAYTLDERDEEIEFP